MKLKDVLLAAISISLGFQLGVIAELPRDPWETLEADLEKIESENPILYALQNDSKLLRSLRLAAASSGQIRAERVWLSLLVKSGESCMSHELIDHSAKHTPELLNLDREFYQSQLAEPPCGSK